MPDLTISIPHQLTQAEAKERIRDQVGLLRQHQAGVPAEFSETWIGDRMDFRIHAAGQTVAGYLIVGDQVVQVSIKLPWMLSLLAGSIMQRLESKIRQALEGPKT